MGVHRAARSRLIGSEDMRHPNKLIKMLVLLVALLPAFVVTYAFVTSSEGSTLFLDNLGTGAIKHVRLTYEAEGLQVIRLEEEVHFIKDACVTLVADFFGSGGKIMLNLTLDIRGTADAHRYDGTTSTTRNYARQKSLLLEYVRGSYCHDSDGVGMLPILVRPEDILAIESVYFVSKGETLDLRKHDFVEIVGRRFPAFVINTEKRTITYYGTDFTREMPFVPRIYAEIADYTSKTELLILEYSEVSPKVPMSFQLLVEESTGVAIWFKLIGAPMVAENATLRYDDEEYTHYPISPIGIRYDIATPFVLFQLERIDIER